MSKMIRTYEIYEEETGVLLVDGLTFDEAAEQSAVYAEFFEAQVVVACRDWRNNLTKLTPVKAFKESFISYFAELQEMGNLN